MRKIKAKRIVIKVGTNVLTKQNGTLNTERIGNIAKVIAGLKKEFIIVTSGAIGCGCKELSIKQRPRDIILRQACAAIGQSILMNAYNNMFSKEGIKTAQILLTYDDFSDRKRYLNLRNSINKLISLGIVPIINENDAISTAEIDMSFGDNDRLSALVASKMEADLLIMLSDIDGLYNKNPKTNRDAKVIKEVREITKEIERITAGKGSAMAIGGMKSKIEAAKITMQSGCSLVIINGKIKKPITRVLKGEELGTLFIPKKALKNKERWIIHAKTKGRIIINKRAEEILLKKKASLLSVGIERIEGSFSKRDVVEINNFAKAMTDYSSEELKNLRGKKGIVAIKHENIVIINK